MKYLILTITKNPCEKDNVLKNMKDLSSLPNEFQYLVYSNYSLPDAIQEDFTNYNEMFYNLRNVIRKYDYLLLLHGKDNYNPIKSEVITKYVNKKHFNYLHNGATYNNSHYFYNKPYNYTKNLSTYIEPAYRDYSIFHNISCITVLTKQINFKLFQNTQTLWDFLLWLPIQSKVYKTPALATHINLQPLTYQQYKEQTIQQYQLQLQDLQRLYSVYSQSYMGKKLLSEINRINTILGHYTGYSNFSTFLHRKKDTNYFLKREYSIKY